MRRRIRGIWIGIVVAFCLLGSTSYGQKPFEGVKLTALIGAGGEAPLLTYHVDYLKEVLGVDFEIINEPDPNHYQLLMKDWMTGEGAYDIVTSIPRWNGDFMGGGYFLPITEYLKKDPEAMKDYEDIVETYRKIYCEWGGEIYGIVVDGDAQILYYRKDIFENPDYQARFKERYGYDLPIPPQTWDQFRDVAEFFTGWDWDNDGEVEYGASFSGIDFPQHVYMYWAPVFASYSNGLYPFDKELRPQINNEFGIKALQLFKEVCTKYAPEGFIGMTIVATWQAFWQGKVAMALDWGDVGKYLLCDERGEGCGLHWKGKVGYALWPGVEHEGALVQYNTLSYGRIMAIPRSTKYPDAAYAVLRELLRPERKMISLSDWVSCADVYAYSARDASKWTIPIEQEFIDAYLGALAHGVPDLMIPGNEEYYMEFGKIVTSYLLGEFDEKTALSKAEEAWERITERLGRKKLVEIWQAYVEGTLEKLGFKFKL